MITNLGNNQNIALELQTEIVSQLFKKLEQLSEDNTEDSGAGTEFEKMKHSKSQFFVFYDVVKKEFFQIEKKTISYILPITRFDEFTYTKERISELKKIHPLKTIPLFRGGLGLDSPTVLKYIIDSAKREELFDLVKTEFYSDYDINKKMVTEKLTNLSPFYNQLIVDSSLKDVSPLLLELFQDGVADLDVFDVGKKVIGNLFGLPSKGSNQFNSKWSETKEKLLLYFYLFQDDKKLVENWVQTMMNEIDYHLEKGRKLISDNHTLQSEIVTALLPLTGIVPEAKKVLMKIDSLDSARVKSALYRSKMDIANNSKPYTFEQEFLMKCLASLFEDELPLVTLYYPHFELKNILYSKYCKKLVQFGEGDDLLESNRFLGDGGEHYQEINRLSKLSEKWNVTLSHKLISYKKILKIYLEDFDGSLDKEALEEFSDERYNTGYQSGSEARSEEFGEERNEFESQITELEARIENFEEENRDLQEQISDLEQELDNYR
jgi:hypothetical protein